MARATLARGRHLLLAALLSIVLTGAVAGSARGAVALAQRWGPDAYLVETTTLILALDTFGRAPRRGDPHPGFGYGAVDLLGACVSSLLFLFLAGAITYESVHRLEQPEADQHLLGIVATCTLLFNCIRVMLRRPAAMRHRSTYATHVQMCRASLGAPSVLASSIVVLLTHLPALHPLLTCTVAAFIAWPSLTAVGAKLDAVLDM